MKNLLIVFCLVVTLQGCATSNHLSCSRAAAGSFVIISDVDDTVKVTNVPHFFAKLKNGLRGRSTFAGMPELYQALLDNSASGSLEFVSGTPAILRRSLEKTLHDACFSYRQLSLRPNPLGDARRFKTECLNQIYGSDSAPQFILVGDDTEKDLEVYSEFKRGHKDSAIYIHRITGKCDSCSSDMRVFTTAYDIAMYEAVDGRLSPEQAEVVGEAVLTAPDSVFLPKFQKCPQESAQIQNLPEDLERLKELIDRRTQKLCQSRQAGSGRSV